MSIFQIPCSIMTYTLEYSSVMLESDVRGKWPLCGYGLQIPERVLYIFQILSQIYCFISSKP